jgi:hypothetical protein
MWNSHEEIIDPEKGIVHKTIPGTLVAGFSFRSGYEELRKLIPANLEELEKLIGEFICGPAIVLLDYGVYSDAVHVEVAYPITSAVEKEGIRSWTLEPVEVLSVIHHGSHANLDKSYKRIYGFMREHGEVGTSFGREIYIKNNPSNPNENVTELQAILHLWGDRLRKNIVRVLNPSAERNIMKGSDNLFRLDSMKEERVAWLKGAIERLDNIADPEQKYEILSCCAHEFSDIRIAQLRDIYEKTGSVDEVLEFMNKDYDWYEAPLREGDIVYTTKIPYNRKAYEEAKTRDEKRRSYCHCGMVREYLDSGISPTFCNCSAGWYRQQWEGILGKKVKIDILKSLVRGDDTCQFAIHLPRDSIERAGE